MESLDRSWISLYKGQGQVGKLRFPARPLLVDLFGFAHFLNAYRIMIVIFDHPYILDS